MRRVSTQLAAGALGIVLLGLAAACEPSSESKPTCVRAAIVGGTERAEYLALASPQERAIVQLLLRGGGQEAACSGVVIADGVLLTAAHCLNWEPEELMIVDGSDSLDVRSVDPTTAVLHPELDLALLKWEEAEPFAVPIPVASDPVESGSLIQSAGFGINEGGDVGLRRFAVEPVIDRDSSTFRVDAGGRAGSCDGDSGGPALVRDAAGRVAVSGILSSGAVGCAAGDEYVALAGLADWFATNGVPEVLSEALVACELLPVGGRCFGAAVAYCSADGEPHVVACSDDETCGYSPDDGAFRCVATEDDPCAGVGDRGRCEGDERIRCKDGVLERSRCDACDAHCVYSARDARAICNAAG